MTSRSPRESRVRARAQLRLQTLGGHRADDAVLQFFRRRLGADPRQRHIVAGLLAPMPCHQVGRDAEQPRPQAPAAGVEPVPLAERHQKRLGRDVIGCLRAQPAAHIAEDVAGVPVVDDGEHLRVTLEPGGEFGVRHRVAQAGGHDSALVIQVPFRPESPLSPILRRSAQSVPGRGQHRADQQARDERPEGGADAEEGQAGRRDDERNRRRLAARRPPTGRPTATPRAWPSSASPATAPITSAGAALTNVVSAAEISANTR